MDSKKIKAIVTSALETFAGVAVAQYSMGEKDIKMIAVAGIAAVIVPAIRAINPKDPAFGMVANIADAELKKLAKKSAKKKK
jgi:hypothetical protein